jgi:hypothetical protein
MNRNRLIASSLIAVIGLIIVQSIAIGEPSKDSKPAGQPEIKLPPGWTEDDLKAEMMAGTPGKMHERLAKDVGVWQGKCSMWMPPGGGEPMKSDCTMTITSIMDGRYFKSEMSGEMAGMGPYNGFGIGGFDNVSQKFVSTWIDNHSTGILTGTGDLTPDGKTVNWNFTYNCPITKKPVVLRQIDTVTGPGAKTLEMFGADPKTGKEYKMMRIEFTKK